MSTYSWSYKNASHRQLVVKKTTFEDNGQDVVNTSSLTAPQKRTVPNSINVNEDQTATKPKRLNWRAKLYVGNLNKKTTEASLAYYFRVFGDLDDVKLIRDHDTKESRGFAFITFEKTESAEKAKKWCSFNYPTIDDNSITVASAERKVPKSKPAFSNEIAARRDPSQTLFWEYKWTNEKDAQVYGPYETSLMLAWKNQGYFDAGCWVRQVHRDIRRVVEKREEKDMDECDETPSKKLKLVADYSDSEDEETDDVVGSEEGIEGKDRERREKGGCEEDTEVIERVKKEEQGENEDHRRRQGKSVCQANIERLGERHKEEGQCDQELDKVKGKGERRDINEEVKETVDRIVDMVVENINKEKEKEQQLEQYIKHVRTISEDEQETIENSRRDDFSSDEEDSKDELSTEFVAISEIDFNFFP